MKVDIFHPNLNNKGGADLVSANIIYAASCEHDITLYTLVQPKWETVNSDALTSINGNEIDVVTMDEIRCIPYKLRMSIFHRIAKKYTAKNRISICTSGRADMGCKYSIQYIHSLRYFNSSKLKKYYPDKFRRNNQTAIHTVLTKVANLLGPPPESTRCNLSIVNSEWTKEVCKKILNIEPLVINPPILLKNTYDTPDWGDKENTILCIGTICKPKKQLEVIKIYERVSNLVSFDIELKIVGKNKKNDYSKKVMNKIVKTRGVSYTGRLERPRLENLMKHAKYGIHGKRKEHFGMSVAEMVSSGMIVFVPNGGGQTEIVNNSEQLIYKNKHDAVNKIRKVLGNKKLQTTLLDNLRTTRFSQGKFIKKIRVALSNVIEAKRTA